MTGRRTTVAVLVAAMGVGAAAGVVWTQERPQDGRGPGGPGMSPVLAALDADHDGTISRAEIAGAPAALRSLDKNADGALTADEIRPAFGRGGRDGGPGRGFGERGRGERGEPGETPPTSADELVSTLMAFDGNGDGKLTRAEVPERLQGLFERADADKDGSLSAEELKKSAASQSSPSAEGPGSGRGEGRRGRGPDGGPGRDPIVNVLDANHDGTISADEIGASAAALATLDRNGDGTLTADEVRPAFGRGRGGPRVRPAAAGQRP